MSTNAIPCKTHNVVQHIFTCRHKGKSVLANSVFGQRLMLKASVCHAGWQMNCTFFWFDSLALPFMIHLVLFKIYLVLSLSLE